MTRPVFAPWPVFDREIKQAVTVVLSSGLVNQWNGRHVYAFEEEYAASLGVKHAIAMANGSVTLDTALKVLGVGAGDEVVVASRSFVASASCVALTGAMPVFADVDPQSGNITAGTIAPVLTERTKGIIVVHLAGWPCDMDPVLALAKKHGLFVIEDCAQAHGARYKGRPVGSFGQFASFSFCQDKIFTTGGEGGLLATNDSRLWEKAWSLKDHGRDFDVVFHQKGGTGFNWMVNSFGTNYRMTEMQAVIGRIMLKRLEGMVSKRRRYAEMLNDAFERTSGLSVTRPDEKTYHSYYKYYVLVDTKSHKKGWSRDRILDELTKMGIPCGSGACPEIYREKAFRDQRKKSGLKPQPRLPVARDLGERSIMLQVHPTLSQAWIKYVIASVKEVMARAV